MKLFYPNNIISRNFLIKLIYLHVFDRIEQRFAKNETWRRHLSPKPESCICPPGPPGPPGPAGP